MFKKLIVIVIIIVAGVILIGLSRQIYDALWVDKRFDTVLEDVTNLEKENRELKKELTKAESLDSIEQLARDDLNMALDNETIVVIPENTIERVVNPPPVFLPEKPSNWEAWFRLFLH